MLNIGRIKCVLVYSCFLISLTSLHLKIKQTKIHSISSALKTTILVYIRNFCFKIDNINLQEITTLN